MTDGSMNCLSNHVVCGVKQKPQHLRWVSLLKELMQQGLPGCQVDVHVVVRPASRSDVLLDRGVVDSHDDIVLEDFTVNDQRGAAVSQDGRLNDTRILTSVIAGHEVLAQSGCG